MAHLNSNPRSVTIGGGGLAGLSLACGLRGHGVPVTVHEAAHYPRHRVCGEFISGVAETTLDFLGIRDLFADAVRLRSVAWLRCGRILHEDELPEAAYGISRHRLDARLAARARERGAEVIEGSRRVCGPGEGQVWAAGRVPTAQGRWLGLKCHFSGLPRSADLEMHLGGNGYVGLAEIEDGRVNVCGLFQLDRDLKASGSALLVAYLRAGGAAALADRLAAALADESSFRAVAGFEPGRQPERPGILALGDAESMIPPFTGNGMSMAFQAAALATGALAAWQAGESSWAQVLAGVKADLRRTFRKRLAAAGFLHPFLLHPAGRRLLESMGRTGVLPFRSFLALVR